MWYSVVRIHCQWPGLGSNQDPKQPRETETSIRHASAKMHAGKCKGSFKSGNRPNCARTRIQLVGM